MIYFAFWSVTVTKWTKMDGPIGIKGMKHVGQREWMILRPENGRSRRKLDYWLKRSSTFVRYRPFWSKAVHYRLLHSILLK